VLLLLQGEKVFYLIPPNSKNLALYEEWMLSPDKQETFLADQADVCFRLVYGYFYHILHYYYTYTHGAVLVAVYLN